MKRILFVASAALVFASQPVMAEISDEEFQALREQLAAVSARLDELAAENAELKAQQAQTTAAVDEVETTVASLPESSESWADRVALSGDFRYRYENIDPQGSSTRNRNRIRARTNLKADLNDDVEVGFGLATGGDDPVSTNQTLGGGGSSKGVVLNLAYVDWEVADGMHLLGGKFKNPFTRVGGQPLMWDGDWTPEGIALKYKRGNFFVNALGTFLESDTKKSNDTFAFGGQIGASATIGDINVTGGVGYISIPVKGQTTNFGDPTDPGDFFGNTAIEAGGLACGTTADTLCTYRYDYNLAQVFGEAKFEVGSWPALVFFDYVNNNDPSTNNTGWTLGTRFGQAKDRGEKQFTYYYADKEADSMLGLLTDSDFGGGGTDSKGHWLQFNYGVSKSLAVGAQYFINEVNLSTGSKSDYNRLMIDMQWKWK